MEVLVSVEGRQENLGKWVITGTSVVIQVGGWWLISKENTIVYPLLPSIKISLVPQFSQMPDQILGKTEKTQFSSQNLIFFSAIPLKNVMTYSKVLYMTTRSML